MIKPRILVGFSIIQRLSFEPELASQLGRLIYSTAYIGDSANSKLLWEIF